MPNFLTPNAITVMNAGDFNAKPLVQIIDIKRRYTGRYFFVISDGVFAQQAMVRKALDEQMINEGIVKGSVIQIINFMCNRYDFGRVMAIVRMKTFLPECDIIGNPKLIGKVWELPDPDLTAHIPDLAQILMPTPQTPMPIPMPMMPIPMHMMPNDTSQTTIPSMSDKFNGFELGIIPIAALNPYQDHWAIKARVTAKGNLQSYNNEKGSGKVFYFDLLDSGRGEIRVVCFDDVVDQFYDTIKVGKVYVISNGMLKSVKSNFDHLKNPWEIILKVTSIVFLCPSDEASESR